MNRVVVGFDFSSGSAYAVDLAIDIANRWESDIRLVYVKEKNEDEEEALKASAMLFSRREISNNFINKLSEHFSSQIPIPKNTATPDIAVPSPALESEPEPKTQENDTNERSVDMLMERLNLIKKHI